MKASLVRQEILTAATDIAQEKGIDRERVLSAMESAFEKAAHAKYGQRVHIKATIDRKTGEVLLLQKRQVVEEVSDPVLEISLGDAQAQKPELKLDDCYEEVIPPIDFQRVAAQQMRQVMSVCIQAIVREKEYEEYKDKVGELVNGLVKSVDYGNVVLTFGRAEGLLRREEMIPRERFNPGDRVRAYIKDVHQDPKGYQIFLSRTDSRFMVALFKQEVPEVYSEVIEIRAVARDPGSRAKIGVFSKDTSIDPVGSCVGVRGNRVQAVTQELQGERIDVIRWSDDPITFLVNAMAPAEITKVIMGDSEKSVEVVVPDEQLSLAIGRRGQNVSLASKLVGLSVDIITESNELSRRTEFTEKVMREFMEALTIDEVMARLLVTEGFESVADLAATDAQELSSLEGFNEELAAELRARAEKFLVADQSKKREDFIQAGGETELIDLEGLSSDLLPKLSEGGIKSLKNFAELAEDELIDIVGAGLLDGQGGDLIMKARAIVFRDSSPANT
jgi:N utilization substance protein A